MSYTQVFVISKRGSISFAGEAQNGMGFCPVIWDALGLKYGIAVPGTGYESMTSLDIEKCRKLWKMFVPPDGPPGKLTPGENLVLGSTFDHIWVKRERLEALCDGYDQIYEELIKPALKTDTVVRVAQIIRSVLKRKTLGGVCFTATTVGETMWVHPEREGRFINILKHPNCIDGKAHWELGS